MFQYPATELFDADGARRVVWSQQEFEEALAAGWREERPAEPTPELLQEPAADEAPADSPAPRKRIKPGREE